MRPRILEIEGLQSFRTRQRIDFDALSDNGLFGIFGPTGSGKSTILDAITFALYGRVKRAENGTQGIINIHEQQARVSFTFELTREGKRRCYRVERLYQRKKGTASQCEAKLARLIEVTEAGEIPVCDKVLDVTRTIEGLLGLTEKDFTRAVVLPQNSFQEFLLLSSKERRDMLERIFYLEEYGRELQEKLFRKMGRLRSLLDKLSGELKGYEDADDQALEQANSAMEEAAAKRNEAVMAFSQTEKRYQEAKAVWELVQEYEAILEQEQTHEALREGITLKRSLLERAVRADSLRDSIEQVRGLEEASRKAETEVAETTQRLAAAEAGLKESRDSFDNLKKEAAQEQPRLIALKARLEQAFGILQDADILKSGINHLESQLGQLKLAVREKTDAISRETAQYNKMEKELAQYGEQSASLRIDPEYRQRVQTGLTLQHESTVSAKEAVELERKAQTWQGAVRGLQLQLLEVTDAVSRQLKEIERTKAEQQSLIDRKPEDRSILEQKNDRLHGLRLAYNILEDRWNAQKELKKKQTGIEGELDALSQRLAIQKEAEQSAKQHLDSLNEDVKRLVKEQDEHIARRLSLMLKEGQPCPVCGSSHHPNPIHLEGETDTMEMDQQLERAKVCLETADKAHKEAERAVLMLEQQISSRQGQIHDIGKELSLKEEAMNLERQKLPEALRGLPLEGIQKELERMNTISLEKQRALTLWENEEKALSEQLQTQNDALNALRLKENGLAAELKTNRENLEQAEGALIEGRQEAETALRQYHDYLGGLGILDAKQELDRILDADKRLHELQNTMDGLSKAIAAKKAEISALELELRQQQGDLIRIETERTQVESQLQGLMVRIKELSGNADIQTELTSVKAKLESYDHLLKEGTAVLEQREKEYRDLESQKLVLLSRSRMLAESYAKEHDRLKGLLVEKGFEDVQAVKSAVISPERQAAYRQEIDDFDRREHYLKSQRYAIEGRLNDRRLTEDEWKAVCEAYTESAAYKEACVSGSEVARNVYETIKVKHDKWVELNKHYQEVSRKQSLYDQIQRLLRADRTKENSFIDYIAEERLRYVAAKASQTLGYMTRFKYGLELDTESGFMIRDYANGGVCRMVSTLSGGETFLTALSLALALSEQIQLKGQSPLEFFFLDEGFGTLDNGLLDNVMDALERISGSERVIGLISHVPELKSRIGRRLVISPPSPQGEGSQVLMERA